MIDLYVAKLSQQRFFFHFSVCLIAIYTIQQAKTSQLTLSDMSDAPMWRRVPGQICDKQSFMNFVEVI